MLQHTPRASGIHGVQELTFGDVAMEVIGTEEIRTEEWSADIGDDENPAECVTAETEVQIPRPVAADGRSIGSSEGNGRSARIAVR